MTRHHRKPPCFGLAWGGDCRSCKYTKECKSEMKIYMGDKDEAMEMERKFN